MKTILVLLAFLLTSCEYEKSYLPPPRPPKIDLIYFDGGNRKYISGHYWYDARKDWIRLWDDSGSEIIIISDKYILNVIEKGK